MLITKKKKAAFPKKNCFSLAAEEGFEPSQTESELPKCVNYGVFLCAFWLCQFHFKKNKNSSEGLFFVE